MKSRCYNPQNKSYGRYGARGITICDEWLDNPLLFEEWSLTHGYSDDLTIDRIDVDKGYYPENCRWVSLEYNSRYKSTSKEMVVDGESHTGREWAAKLGLPINAINKIRLKHGEDVTKELIHRILKQGVLNKAESHAKSKKSWLEMYGIV